MVVELTSAWTLAEYRMAIARLKETAAASSHRQRLQLILVVTHAEQVPPSARDLAIITRPNILTDDLESFITELGSQLRSIAANLERCTETSPGAYSKPNNFAPLLFLR